MASSNADQRKFTDYSYAAMSNLVTKADRRTLPKTVSDGTGEPESLAGRVNVNDMGSRARSVDKRAVAQESANSRTVRTRLGSASTRLTRRKKRANGSNKADITDYQDISYHPTTTENKVIFEAILSAIGQVLSDQSPEVVRSAADFILEVLKSDMGEVEKKSSIESALGTILLDAQFIQFVQLARKVTDFGQEAQSLLANTVNDENIAVIIDADAEGEASSEADSDSDIEEDDTIPAATEAEQAFEEQDSEAMIIETDGPDITKQRHSSRIDIREIDEFWLQRRIAMAYSDNVDAASLQEKARSVLVLLESPISDTIAENDLMELFDFEKHDLVQIFIQNRLKIIWGMKVARASAEEVKELIQKMRLEGLSVIADELDGLDESHTAVTEKLVPQLSASALKSLDLDNLAFADGAHHMSNKKVLLPEGSFKRSHASYEEVHIPASTHRARHSLRKVAIADMPNWTHSAFANTTSLNHIQSCMYDTAFQAEDNILLCAPTGAGKTNVAMLCILHEISKHRSATDEIDKGVFKVVYIAPLKALVSEMVGNFSTRLSPYGITVSELTGDSQLTKQQIASTQIIVTTPEKWDVITRKADDTSYTNLVRLIIIDEIHLLHDTRGPVIESIVTRVHRDYDAGSTKTRLVGLSATLPNYEDVATFLRVSADRGLFYFDQTYRPCPLQQDYIGITERKPIKRLQIMNTICYDKVMASLAKSNQVLIFVHSRKETYKTAKFLRDHALQEDTVQRLTRGDAASREILTREADAVSDNGLRELLPYGIAMHHAGMNKVDRTTAEDLFAEGLIQVLVSTATLAWGVNLPAHTVIIKGTQVYSPEKGCWTELSFQDVLQMLGRAGRPQYDTFGEGVIITHQSELQYYLSLLNQQLPIESQLVSKLCDSMNAEVVLGTIRSREDAVTWLGYSYLYIRMLKDPILYQVGPQDPSDGALYQKRIDLVHSAAIILARCNMVNYDVASGTMTATDLGRVASHYYISHDSMKTYNQHLKAGVGLIELLRVFALSEEFKYIPVREDEKLEIQKLLDRVPVPVKDSPDDTSCKINVLLQAHISRLKLEGFALLADMVFVTQSAGRLMRSIFEICLRRGWSNAARLSLQLCQMIETGIWSTRLPLAQFTDCPKDLLRKLERKEFPWSRYFDLDKNELGELCGEQRAGNIVHRYVHCFPRLDLKAHIQPITRSLIRVELTIIPNFIWDENYHGASQSFWVLVDDVNGETLLHQEKFILRKAYVDSEHTVEFTIKLSSPMSPLYYCTVLSDRWQHSSSKVAISLRTLTLPAQFPPHTTLIDLQCLSTGKINDMFSKIVFDFPFFNLVQTQTYHTLMQSQKSVLIAAPCGTGKFSCAELSIVQHISSEQATNIVMLCPTKSVVARRMQQLSLRFQQLPLTFTCFGDDMAENNRLMQTNHLVVATFSQFEIYSRRWRQRKALHKLGLLIIDHLHLLGGTVGADLEIAVSRARFIAEQTESTLRIIALSEALADHRDMIDWLGIDSSDAFSFDIDCRLRMQIHLQAYDQSHYPSFLVAASKVLKTMLEAEQPRQLTSKRPLAFIFVDDRRQCLETASEVQPVHSEALDHNEDDLKLLESFKSDPLLRDLLTRGIGYLHELMSEEQKNVLFHFCAKGCIATVVIARAATTDMPFHANLAVILGTQSYDGVQHRYVHYPISDILEMLASCAEGAKVVLMTSSSRRTYYKKFLEEGLPVESQYQLRIHDNLVAEVSSETIETKQEAVDWLTWTFFYRRLTSNPSYYGLTDPHHDAISAFLSDLVENTLSELSEGSLIEVGSDEMQLSAQNLGLIAFHYAINYITAQTFALSLTERTKLKGLLEIVTSASEFDELPIRRHEDIVLRRLYDKLPVKLDINFEEPHHKAFILVQAYFSRLQLPVDLQADQNYVLRHMPTLLSACVDIQSSEGRLNAISAMELSQMCVQAVWDRDSPLRQIPGFSADVIERCNAADVHEVAQIAELDDAIRLETLQMNSTQLNEVARFCNHYPDYEMAYELEDSIPLVVDQACTLRVQLTRECEEEDPDISVSAMYYPHEKTEHWWLLVADTESVLAIKKVTLKRELVLSLEFTPRVPGRQQLTLSCISDSYIGADQEQTIDVDVSENDRMDED